MPSAARLGDLIGHAPPIPPDARGRGGPGGVPTGLIIGPCSGNVFINGIPAARSGVDLAVCSLHPPVPLPIASGSSNVFINGCPAVRLGDLIKCSAIVITGSGNVFIGGGGSGASGTVQTGVLIPELETEPVILQSLEASDAGADSLELDESIPSMSYGEQMKKVGGFYGDLAIGAAKGILNLIPETAAFAYRMSGYAIAGVVSHFDSDISYAMFSKYEKVTGRIWQYENSVQAFGGVAAQVASPMIFRGATAVGAVIYNAETGAVWATSGGSSAVARQMGAIDVASSSRGNSSTKVADSIAAGDTVTVFRVQGGTPPAASRHRIKIDSNGDPVIGNATVNISIGDPAHAGHFQTLRPGSKVTSFEIPTWMDDFIRESAIPQVGYRSNPLNQRGLAPKIVDPTTPGRSYEMPAPWGKWLEETAVPGSGKVK